MVDDSLFSTKTVLWKEKCNCSWIFFLSVCDYLWLYLCSLIYILGESLKLLMHFTCNTWRESIAVLPLLTQPLEMYILNLFEITGYYSYAYIVCVYIYIYVYVYILLSCLLCSMIFFWKSMQNVHASQYCIYPVASIERRWH